MITRTKLNSSKFSVKTVVNTLVIKQDISKVKFIKPTEFRTQPHTQLSHTSPRSALHFGQEVEVIVNETSKIKLKVNPTGTASENLEHHINELLKRNYFPRYKYQLS